MMEQLHTVFCDDVESQYQACFVENLSEIDRMIDVLNTAEDALMSDATTDGVQVAIHGVEHAMDVNTAKEQSSQRFKLLHQNLTKYSKQIDATLPSGLDTIIHTHTPVDDNSVNAMIVEQWLRDGRVALAEQLMSKCDYMKLSSDSRAFIEIRNLVEALQSHNVEPMLQWIDEHKDAVSTDVYTNIKFKLYRLQYLQLLQENVMVAITYAQKCIAPYANSLPTEVQQLGGCLVYAPTLPSSPYSELVSPHAWLEAEYEFTTEYCRVMGFAPNSPLYLCVRASRVVIPKLMKYEAVRRSSNGALGGDATISVHLDKEFQFHSTFVCPVTKEESTPWLLECGHCISRKAMDSILANSRSKSFKCPYCPMTQSTKRIIQLHI